LSQALTVKYSFSLPVIQANFKPAFLLAADNKNRIRFVPNTGFTGTVNDGVVYNGWNQRTAGNGLLINIDDNSAHPTTNPRASLAPLFNSLSVNADRLNIKVNKAPILDPSLVAIVGNIPVNPVTNPGTLVSTILGTGFNDDQAVLKGMAVTEVDNSNGTWQYALDGTTWQAFGSPNNSNARLLSADSTTRIRFVPNSGYIGTPGIKFRAWDQFADWGVAPVAGGTTNVNTNGGVTAFSNVVAETKIGVGTPVVTPAPGPIAPVPVSEPAVLDPGFLPLLKNPPAPPTPNAVVVGEAPVEILDNTSGITGSPITEGNGNSAAGNEDCPCETIIKQQKPNPVIGTIQGTNEDDSLSGAVSVNTIYGLQGNDTITGTPNPDNLYGGQGNDLIRGLRQRDFIQGGGGDDTLYGGRGRDVVKGGRGNDFISGGRGADFLGGGNGNDNIYGDRGNDFISGGKGSDRLFGGAGNDNLCGCKGTDFLRGGRGNDVLNGDRGQDILVGGFGDDTLTGGKGKDRFRFAPSTGTDTITDFTVGEDLIELVKGLKLTDLQITQGIGATVIGFQPGSLFASDKPLALLTGVNAASLTPNSFLVV
jgi:Ca2+-binding RTX toxin-like protein